jgi:hypothetical protein
MKNFILIAFLFIAFSVEAQTAKPIDGFLGIKFGSYPGQVIDALKAKGAFEDMDYNNNYNRTGNLRFKHVLLGSRTCADFIVSFANDQACQAEFIFDPEVETESVNYYLALVKDIRSVYGNGEMEHNRENSVGHDDIKDIKSGYANFATNWNDGSNLIRTHITLSKYTGIQVNLIYRNYHLFNLYQAQQNEKNKSEL